MTATPHKPRPQPTPQHLPFLTLVLLLLMALHACHGTLRSWLSGRYRATATFRRALDICLDEYVESRPTDELVRGAVEGMVNSLADPHSAFLAPPDNHRLSENEAGKYAGLGVLIRLRNERLVIQKVFEGSPAEAAGLQRADVILSASELDPEGLKPPVVTDLSQITNLAKTTAVLRGKIGTRVTLGILRGEEKLDITVERREIKRPATEHRVLAGQIGYLRISDFPDTVALQVAAAIAELRRKEVRCLLIDLRGNVGGFLDEAVRVADLFIADGVIVSTRNRNHHEDRVFRASPGGPAEDLPLAVVVDGGSASAAEVVAGSLQDHERARLVGTKTYGKGAVSKRFPLADGSGILLSTGRYHLPKGRQIEGKGLEPDLVVQPPKPPKREDIDKLPPDAELPDPQLDAAEKLLREQLAAGG